MNILNTNNIQANNFEVIVLIRQKHVLDDAETLGVT